MADFDLVINTPQKQLFKGKAESVNVPGEEGYMTILSHHAPLLAQLKEGKITVIAPSGKTEISISSGFVEVNESGVTLLVRE